MESKLKRKKCAINLLVIGRDGNGKSSTMKSIENATERLSMPFTLKAVECEAVGDLSEDLQVPIEDVVRTLSEGIKASESCPPAEQRDAHARDSTTDALNAHKYAEDRTTDAKGRYKDKNAGGIYRTLAKTTEKPRKAGGIVAFLFVLKFGVRFTKQEKDAVEAVKQMLGEYIFKKWVIIIFTYGDMFKLYNDENKRPFLDWCKEQTGDIQKLFLEVDYRVVLFDNKTKDQEVQKDQLGNLLKYINKLVNDDSFVPYRSSDLAKADPLRLEFIQTQTKPKPKIKDNFINESKYTWLLALVGRTCKDKPFQMTLIFSMLGIFLFYVNRTNGSNGDGCANLWSKIKTFFLPWVV